MPLTRSTMGLLVMLAACGDNGGTGFDGPPGPADAPPVFDAPADATAADAAADGGAIDAQAADAGPPDASPQDAEPALTATVRVTQEDFDPAPGTPVAGAVIAVLDASGGVATSITTDATGVATVPVAAASRMWVGRGPVGSSGEGQLYYIASVAPADVINLGTPAGTGASADGTLAITYPPVAGGAGTISADDYLGDCAMYTGAPAGQVRYGTEAGCPAPAKELVIKSTNAGWLNVPGVAPVPGTIDATALAWDTVGAVYSATHSGLPTGVEGVDYASTAVGSPGGSWHWVGLPAAIVGGAGTATAVDAKLTPPMVAYAELDIGFPSTTRSQYTSDPVITGSDCGVTGSTLLPFITGPSISPATRTITWSTVTPGPVAPQLVTSSFGYFDGATSTSYRWTLYVPGTATEIVFPDVPDVVTTHDLAAGAFLTPDLLLVHAEGSSFSDLLTDYDLYRFDRYQNYRYKHGFRPTVRSRISGGGFYGFL